MKCDYDEECQGDEEITVLAHIRRDEAGELYLHELNTLDVKSVVHDYEEDHSHEVEHTDEQARTVRPELEALAKQVMNPHADKWTVVVEFYGDCPPEPTVIHASGETKEAGREDAARQVHEQQGVALQLGDGEDADAYIVAMFRGHHEGVQW